MNNISTHFTKQSFWIPFFSFRTPPFSFRRFSLVKKRIFIFPFVFYRRFLQICLPKFFLNAPPLAQLFHQSSCLLFFFEVFFIRHRKQLEILCFNGFQNTLILFLYACVLLQYTCSLSVYACVLSHNAYIIFHGTCIWLRNTCIGSRNTCIALQDNCTWREGVRILRKNANIPGSNE